jgi:hypothetical protein
MIVSERKISGRMSADQEETGAPASCSTTMATERWPAYRRVSQAESTTGGGNACCGYPAASSGIEMPATQK